MSQRKIDRMCLMPTDWQHVRDIVAVIADVVSLVGFIVTVGVAIALRRLRAFYVFKGRVPDLTKRIAERTSRSSDLAADFINTSADIRNEVRQIGILTESLAQKSSGPAKAAAKRLARKLKNAPVETRTEWTDLYGELQTLLARYEEVQRDLEWER